MNHEFVKDVETLNTGGNIMNDIITLSNGNILVLSEGLIGLYNSFESYDNGDIPIKMIDIDI